MVSVQDGQYDDDYYPDNQSGQHRSPNSHVPQRRRPLHRIHALPHLRWYGVGGVHAGWSMGSRTTSYVVSLGEVDTGTCQDGPVGV